MCGRFVLKTSVQDLQTQFQIQRLRFSPEQNYNLAPTQNVAAVVQSPKGTRGLIALQWGLIPTWAKDNKTPRINARSETVHQKPTFRDAFRQQRCLIPANGFYEWKKGDKQPIFIFAKDQPTMAFAGLYSFWLNAQGQRVDTCAILTTAANETIHDVHHRMPVILPPEDYDLWLDKSVTEPELLQKLLKSYAPEQTGFHFVHPDVNKVSHNHEHNLDVYTPSPQPEQLGFLTDT